MLVGAHAELSTSVILLWGLHAKMSGSQWVSLVVVNGSEGVVEGLFTVLGVFLEVMYIWRHPTQMLNAHYISAQVKRMDVP